MIEDALSRASPHDYSITAGMLRGALQQYGLVFDVPGMGDLTHLGVLHDTAI